MDYFYIITVDEVQATSKNASSLRCSDLTVMKIIVPLSYLLEFWVKPVCSTSIKRQVCISILIL